MDTKLYLTGEGDRQRSLYGITMFLLPSPENTKHYNRKAENKLQYKLQYKQDKKKVKYLISPV